MAISPANNGDVTSSSSSGDLMVKVVGGVIGAIVLFWVAKLVLGFVFTIVKFGIYLAVIAAIIYGVRQVTKKS